MRKAKNILSNNALKTICYSLRKSIERITNFSKIPAFKMRAVWFDENLTLDYHTKVKVKAKMSIMPFSMRKAKNILSNKALKTIDYALVHPHLLYCLLDHSCTSIKNILTLSKMQKDCIKVIIMLISMLKPNLSFMH